MIKQKDLRKQVSRETGVVITKTCTTFNKVINKKTKGEYFVIDAVTNATNAQDGEVMVLYRNIDGALFVRELAEFKKKFIVGYKRAADATK